MKTDMETINTLIERENKLVLECNAWEELCEDMIEKIEQIPNLKKTSDDRRIIEKYYELKGNYEQSK